MPVRKAPPPPRHARAVDLTSIWNEIVSDSSQVVGNYQQAHPQSITLPVVPSTRWNLLPVKPTVPNNSVRPTTAPPEVIYLVFFTRMKCSLNFIFRIVKAIHSSK